MKEANAFKSQFSEFQLQYKVQTTTTTATAATIPLVRAGQNVLGFISGTGSDSRTEASPWQTAVRCCPITIFIEANNNSEVQFEYLLLPPPLSLLLLRFPF